MSEATLQPAPPIMWSDYEPHRAIGNIPRHAQKKDGTDLVVEWRRVFNKEVQNDNFGLGGTSLLFHGKGAEASLPIIAACLRIGKYLVYYMTPYEAQQRVAGLPVLWDNPARRESFEAAEVIVLGDFFAPSAMDDEQIGRFEEFLRKCRDDGIVLLIASDAKEPDLENYGPHVGAFVEKHFEVCRGTKTKPKSSQK